MFDRPDTHESREKVEPVQSKYLIMVVTIIGAAATATIVQILLKSHVSESVGRGAGMYVMWLCLYPAMKAWSRKPEGASLSKKRRLTFVGWAIIGLLPAVMVTITYIYFP